jgi:CTP synthase
VCPDGKPDVLLVEIGGTVGDLESVHFYEAAREMILDHGKENVALVGDFDY